jgi:hypothetical protein
MSSRTAFLLAAAVVAFAAGCGPTPEDDLIVVDDEVQAPAEDKADGLRFSTFQADVGGAGVEPTRRIFTSAESYRRFFGMSPPWHVSFSREWVVFFSAGVRPTGGYRASIRAITRSASGLTLRIATQLESPGEGCFVTQAFTKPHVLAKFPIPSDVRPRYVRYTRDDVVRTCVR